MDSVDTRFQSVSAQVVRGEAPAKVNLFLEVLGKRPDGYHDLETVFHEINLCDRLEVSLRPGGQDELRLDGIDIPGSTGDNLALRAVRLYRNRVESLPPVEIRLHKRVPTGAGLGGGSADAAFVLDALALLTASNLAESELDAMALELGSDVPFLRHGGTAVGRGRGEVLSPLDPSPELWFVLARPDISLSTAMVYDDLALTGPGRDVKPFLKQLQHGYGEGNVDCFNRLERAAFRLAPELSAIRTSLNRRTGRTFTLTGSGSVLFAPFRQESEARASAEQLADSREVQVHVVRSYCRRPATLPP